MKRLRTIVALHLSLWHSLLGFSCIILIYLAGVHISEALNTSSLFTFFNTEHAFLSWEPSQGTVDSYLLEITDTQLMHGGNNTARNRITTKRYETTAVPRYQLDCTHNHSYQVRVKAISPAGHPSEFSEPSILFICDRISPKLSLASLPSSSQKVRSQNITVTGSFDEPHIDALTINDTSPHMDYGRSLFSVDLTLRPGVNSIECYARDLAGNVTRDRSIITYAPVNILSLPGNARIYWNGNYAYAGSYGGTTPRSYNHAGQQKQTLHISLPGFQNFFGIIDFGDLSRDNYVISLVPHVYAPFTQLETIAADEVHALPSFSPRPFVVDYNLDGRKDLLVGNADGTVSLCINRGSNDDPLLSACNPLEIGNAPIDVGTNAAPFLVDYDNNGTFDLLAGNAEGAVLYYHNQGSTRTPVFSAAEELTCLDGTPIKVEGNCTPWVVDWNGDARKDLLLGTGSGAIMLSMNEGSDRHPLFATLRPLGDDGGSMRSDGPSAPCSVDWNADGQLDLLMGRGDGTIQVFYMASEQREPVIASDELIQYNGQTLMLDGAAAPFPVDWNEDGKTDLLIGSGGGIHCLQ